MIYPTGLHPGAVWKKTDFQIHTPRDAQWSNGPHLPGGSAASEAARHKWADAFVAKCIELQLQAIAITDHHDFCFIPYVKDAIARAGRERELWLFPGIEVTCNDSVQCLVLFDCDAPQTICARLFGGHLQNIAEIPIACAECPQTALCGRDIEDFVASLQNDSLVSKCSIVLPHASSDGAHKNILRTGMHERFKRLEVDGVYIEQQFGALDDNAKRKIYGEVAEWGERRKGIISTGDNRDGTFPKLAINPCWIRLGEPTAESIRQALLADEARICYSTPVSPSHHILEVCVNSSLCGNNFRVTMNNGYNAFIGGRGSGKTAVLEYLRFGLGRSSGDDTRTEGVVGERERQLVSSTLRGGEVVVQLERDGVVETWTRKGDDPNRIQIQVAGVNEQITLEAAQERFKARGFAQKQLSTLVTSPATAAEQITGIAAAEFADRRRALDKEIASLQREIAGAVQRVVEYWVAEAQDKEAQASVADLVRRVESIQKRLQESGLSQQTANILNQAPEYQRTASFFSTARQAISDDVATVEAFSNSIPSFSPAEFSIQLEFNAVKEFNVVFAKARTDIHALLSSAAELLKGLENERSRLELEFSNQQAEFTKQHETALTEQTQLRGLIDEGQHVERELREAENRARNSGQRLRSLTDALQLLANARQRLTDALTRKRSVLEEAANVVTEKSRLLRAKVASEQVPKQYLESLLAVCENQRVREGQPKCEERVKTTIASSSSGWNQLGDRLIDVLKTKTQAGLLAQSPSEAISTTLQSEILFEMTAQQISGVYRQLDANLLGRVLSAVRDDFISFEYEDKRRQFIPFAQASPGQQAAALLELLLNQEAGTLIIDQPEDDLDNKVIMKIVTELQKAKRKRQLVFATHNANFVVNGDADKVIALAPVATGNTQQSIGPRIEIESDGAIETSQVRLAITETVEGGREAFELRSRKYKFQDLSI